MKPIALPAALVLLFGANLATAGEVRSIYTEVSEKDCGLLPASGEPDDEPGLRCKGPEGWELLALSGDLRATVTLVAPGGREHALEFWDSVTGFFSTLGPRAEWRVRDVEGKAVPHALIVRVFAQEDPENPARKTSYLAIAKVGPDGSCVTDLVTASADDNERARAAADTAASRPCRGEAQS